MNHTQISISIHNPDAATSTIPLPPYFFLFRTDWMEQPQGEIALQKLRERFHSPEFKITVNDRYTRTTQQEL
jgi:hypothetical protein